MPMIMSRRSSIWLAIVITAWFCFSAVCGAIVQRPFLATTSSRPSGKPVTPTDPLALVDGAQGFAHVSPYSHVVMSDRQQESQAGGSAAVKPNRGYEINRPTRILGDRDHVKACTVTLFEHSFVNSYGHPNVTQYTPDVFADQACKASPNEWLFIELTLEGYAKGRQFDRLGSIQLDGVEVLRTDNQEPSANGTHWSFTKEMNRYFDLFSKRRTLVFDFPNIVNDIYTAPLDMKLNMTVYTAANEKCTLAPLSNNAPIILPISRQKLTENSFFSLGNDFDNRTEGTTKLVIPHNARAAIVEIYASGTAKDEFWYTNIPNADYDRIGGANAGAAYPRGPVREVQLFIDSRLAGVVYPFPVIFTGGINPFLWRPQVAFGAFDQPTYLLDITPFLGTLCNDKEHDFTLKIVSAEQNQDILAWFVSGNVQILSDSSDERTTGEIVRHEAPVAGTYLQAGIEHGNITHNGTAHIEVKTIEPRTLRVEGTVKVGSADKPFTAVWQQSATFSNVNNLNQERSSTIQEAKGSSSSMHGGQAFLRYDYDFPLNMSSVGTNYTFEHGFHLDMQLDKSLAMALREPCSQTIDVTQNGEAQMIIGGDPPGLIGGQGETFCSYAYVDVDGNSFSRDNGVANQTVTFDQVNGTLADKAEGIR